MVSNYVNAASMPRIAQKNVYVHRNELPNTYEVQSRENMSLPSQVPTIDQAPLCGRIFHHHQNHQRIYRPRRKRHIYASGSCKQQKKTDAQQPTRNPAVKNLNSDASAESPRNSGNSTSSAQSFSARSSL